MKKIRLMLFIFLIFMVSIVFAIEINTFDDDTSTFTLTQDNLDEKTITLPSNAFITSATLDIVGRNNSGYITQLEMTAEDYDYSEISSSVTGEWTTAKIQGWLQNNTGTSIKEVDANFDIDYIWEITLDEDPTLSTLGIHWAIGYTGAPNGANTNGYNINLSIYNFNTASWESVSDNQLSEESGQVCKIFNVNKAITSNYKNGNQVRLRYEHSNTDSSTTQTGHSGYTCDGVTLSDVSWGLFSFYYNWTYQNQLNPPAFPEDVILTNNGTTIFNNTGPLTGASQVDLDTSLFNSGLSGYQFLYPLTFTASYYGYLDIENLSIEYGEFSTDSELYPLGLNAHSRDVLVSSELNLTAICTGDFSTYNVSYEIYNNSVLYTSSTSNDLNNNTETLIYNIPSSITTTNDIWYANVSCVYGGIKSDGMLTDKKLIVDNIPVSQSTIISNYNSTTFEMTGYCNATDVDDSILNYDWIWFKNGVEYLSGPNTFNQSNLVHQEYANITSVIAGEDSYLYSTYQKPYNGEIGVLWEVKHGATYYYNPYNPAQYNITISIFNNSDCWYGSQDLKLRIWSHNPITLTSWSEPQCWNGTSWRVVGQRTSNSGSYSGEGSTYTENYMYDGNYNTGVYYNSVSNLWKGPTTSMGGWSKFAYAMIYEEAVWWGYPEGQQYNQGVLTPVETIIASPPNQGDEWMLSCRATDFKGYSEYVNSTILTINGSAPIILTSEITVNDLSISGYCKAEDINLDTISYNYKWYQNDILYSEGSSSFQTQNTSVLVDTLVVSPGTNWTISCQANDSLYTTDYLISGVINITDEPLVSITSPTSGQIIIKNDTIDNVTTIVYINSSLLDTCWYNHYQSGGSPGTDIYFSCINGINQFDIQVDYWGSHLLFVYVNDTRNVTSTKNVTFTLQEQVSGGGGGGGGDYEEKETPVPFFVRELTYEHTCGVDADADGILCDPNEDWISCPEDCDFPSLDSLLCYGDECVWREVWFLKLLFAMLLMITIYLVYIDFTAPKRRRKIF